MTEPLDLFDGRPFGRIFSQLRSQKRIDCIEVVDYPSHDRFHETIVGHHYPVVFRHSESPASKEALIEILESESRQIQVRVGDYAKPGSTVLTREYRTLSVSQYVKELLFSLSDGPPPYAGRIEFSSDLFGPSVQAPAFYPSTEFEPPFIWLGPSGCITQLHKDSAKNFAIHLFGKKRWILFPPRDVPYLYLTRVLEASDFASSAIDLMDVDRVRFPLFENAVAVSVDVKAGQTLFLPEGWAHYVENLEPTLMVNYWHDGASKNKD